MMSNSCDRLNRMVDGIMIAALHQADGEDHPKFASAEAEQGRGLLKQC